MKKLLIGLALAATALFAQIVTIDSADVVKDSRADLNTNFTYLDNRAGANLVLTDTYANLPAAATEGLLFLPTDAPYLLRDTGAAWNHFLPGYRGAVTPPVLGDFAWVNQGSASAVSTFGGILMTVPAITGQELRILKKAIPAVPYTITAHLRVDMPVRANFLTAGLIFRQSSDGKAHVFGIVSDSSSGFPDGLGVYSDKYTDETTRSANYDTTGVERSREFYIRIADDNTNRICSYSATGDNWITMHTIGRTDFLTADEVGIFGNSQQTTFAHTVWVLDWVEE